MYHETNKLSADAAVKRESQGRTFKAEAPFTFSGSAFNRYFSVPAFLGYLESATFPRGQAPRPAKALLESQELDGGA